MAPVNLSTNQTGGTSADHMAAKPDVLVEGLDGSEGSTLEVKLGERCCSAPDDILGEWTLEKRADDRSLWGLRC